MARRLPNDEIGLNKAPALIETLLLERLGKDLKMVKNQSRVLWTIPKRSKLHSKTLN